MKKPSTSLKRKSIPKSKHGNKVDLMIKFNPSDVFKVCSACNEDMEFEPQRPFALFARNGTDALCLRCGKKMAPEYWAILNQFYYPQCRYDPPHYYTPFEDLRSVEYERTERLNKQRRESLIKKIVARGFTKEELQLIVEGSDNYDPNDPLF